MKNKAIALNTGQDSRIFVPGSFSNLLLSRAVVVNYTRLKSSCLPYKGSDIPDAANLSLLLSIPSRNRYTFHLGFGKSNGGQIIPPKRVVTRRWIVSGNFLHFPFQPIILWNFWQ